MLCFIYCYILFLGSSDNISCIVIRFPGAVIGEPNSDEGILVNRIRRQEAKEANESNRTSTGGGTATAGMRR